VEVEVKLKLEVKVKLVQVKVKAKWTVCSMYGRFQSWVLGGLGSNHAISSGHQPTLLLGDPRFTWPYPAVVMSSARDFGIIGELTVRVSQ